MFTSGSIQSTLSFREKVYSIDYILVFSILILGIISMFAIYSTGRGTYDYHTKSHILRFVVFFFFFIAISFFQSKFWYQTATVIYIVFFLLLLGVKYFGLTSSGSQRWINLYVINLQPSELMKNI